MIHTERQKSVAASSSLRRLGYRELVQFLDERWDSALLDRSLATVKKLDEALSKPSASIKTVFVAGTNGKSLTINFLSQLLKSEGLRVGSLCSPHMVTYNERISLNVDLISDSEFVEVGNDVIEAAHSLNLNPHAADLLTVMALAYFSRKKVDVAVLEVSYDCSWDPVAICDPLVCAITRVTDYTEEADEQEIRKSVERFAPIVRKGTWVVAADQSKFNLQVVQDMAHKNNAQWAMPIRKLSVLKYPFEQLHGRCAALAERIGQIFIQNYVPTSVSDSLLAKPKGLRGRPTLEAKRLSEINPKRTVEQFWQATATTIPGRFQMLANCKPPILLDNASNIDAFVNLLLGIRLLHYQRPLKGLVIIAACQDNKLHSTEYFKMLRYFFKKTAGQIIFCPVDSDAQNCKEGTSFDVEQMTNDVKNTKVKAKSAKNLAQALDMAKKSVDEQEGLIVITGSRAAVSQFWHITGDSK